MRLNAALAAAAHGLRVHPLNGKRPMFDDWQALATNDESQIRALWEQHPDANIGYAMGAGAFALDVDGAAGRAELAALEAEHSALPATYTVTSGRADGGQHLYFRCPAERTPGCHRLAPHVDTRGTGGNLVAAGSLHYSGAVYTSNDLPIADAPEWLLAALEAKREANASIPDLDEELLARLDACYDSEPTGAPTRPNAKQRVAIAAIRSECAELAKMIPGAGRDTKVFAASCVAGEFDSAYALEVSVPMVRGAAVASGLDDDAQLQRQIYRGVGKGLQRPRDLSHVTDASSMKGIFDMPETKDDATPSPLKTAGQLLAGLASKPPQRTFATPYPDLNQLIAGGIKARQSTTLIGPSGSGKTGIIGGLARKLEVEIPVLIVATEIDDEENAARLAAQLWHEQHETSDVTPDAILSGRAPAGVLDALGDRRIYILFLEDESKPFDAIAKRAEEIKAATGEYPAIIIDYAQQLTDDDADHKRLSVSACAKAARQLAQILDVPVVLVSSASRAFTSAKARKAMESETDPRAWLTSGMESSGIEYSSAVVMFLDTSSDVDGEGCSAARLVVAKSRRGQVGFVGLKFHGPSGCFTADSGAVERMQERAERQNQEDDAAVLAALRAHQLTKAELRGTVKGRSDARVDAAVARLLATQAIAWSKVQKQNARGQQRKTDVLGVVEAKKAPFSKVSS